MAYTTIDDPGLYFNTIIYTGDGSTKTISGVGFQPDLVWGKGRNSSSDHALIDSVRGATKELSSNNNGVEDTNSTSYLTGFTSDGYTVNSSSNLNVNTRTQVNWNWKAGTTSGISGSPSITPASYSFNATAGFSIIKWTGTGANATLPHGLGVAPAVIIIKNLDGGHWRVYHHKNTSAPETEFLELSDTDATSDDNTAFNDTAPTSTLFSVGSMDETNKNTEGIIAYCFAEKQGYSKFGSYTGNGNADGTFVYTGFKPAFIITKRTNSTSHWLMMDNKRDPFNVADALVVANDSDSESNWGTDRKIDFLSNGFKARSTSTGLNVSGSSYIYLAFAESPFVNSAGSVPNNAR